MLNIHDLRKIANADPKNLPTLIVHDTCLWVGGNMRIGYKPDGTLQVHMNVTSYRELGKQLPLERVRQIGEHTFEARIALEAHHLAGGVNDRAPPAANAKARRGELREALGFDRVSAAPKSEAMPLPIAVAGKAVRNA